VGTAREWLGLALGLTILGIGGTPAIVGAAAQDDPLAFDLVVPERPFAFLPAALPDAVGTATVTAGDGVDELALELSGLPADAAYNLFLTESGAPPFGAIQYLADIETDATGDAEITLETAVLDAFALRGVASDGMLDPAATNETRVDLDHLVVWPKEAATTAAAFEEQGQDPVTTLFDVDGEAGPAILTTALGDAPGPLAADATPAGYDPAAATIVARQTPELGTFLTDREGMTLYRFTKDGPDESACEGDCAATWPPFAPDGAPALALGLPGELGTIERPDGAEQTTYNGMPLYYFAGDQTPGDVNGEGVNDVWFVVEPATA
jgi:predicted lipoprotein with Yx(FWY)xxD motif